MTDRLNDEELRILIAAQERLLYDRPADPITHIAVDIEWWLAVANEEILLALELSLANHARFDALYPEPAA